MAALKQQAKQGPVMLFYSARDERFNQAVALRVILRKPLAQQALQGSRRAT